MSVRLPVPTVEGEFTAHYSEAGLARLEFPGQSGRGRGETPEAIPAHIRKWHAATTKALNEVLAGREPRAWPPLDLSSGTEFQRGVWGMMRQIALGSTKGYGEIAAGLGKAGAARAVGGACGANPIPVLVPCHRVLASHHRLGGFSGGLDWKRKLLAREGVAVAGEPAGK